MARKHIQQSTISHLNGAQIQLSNQTHCANCHSREIRKIANNRYFCPVCCTEFVIFGEKVMVYSITEDGGLKKIG